MKMTIRAALGKKKMLDKQIAAFEREPVFAIVTPQDFFINGMHKDEWSKHVAERVQSFNDKLKYRDRLNVAIMQANANNKLEVPTFNGFDSTTDKKEFISFASAISRKNYYLQLLDFVESLINVRNESSIRLDKLNQKAQTTVHERMAREYGNTTVAVSTNERIKREQEMLTGMKPEFLDPAKLAVKLETFRDYLEEYITEIDAILGHETETVLIDVED